MRKIGLLGGISWESTREYYRIINEQVREHCGGLHSAPIVMESFDFAPIAQLQSEGGWQQLNEQFAQAARNLEHAGARGLLICSNYMHRCADAVEAAVDIPLLHIADAIGRCAQDDGVKTLGLLGAAGTMEQPFYRQRLEAMDIHVLTPEPADRAEINRIIFEELCRGIFAERSRAAMLEMIAALQERGAGGIILGCTEIEQLVMPEHTNARLYPSAYIHAAAATQFILESD